MLIVWLDELDTRIAVLIIFQFSGGMARASAISLKVGYRPSFTTRSPEAFFHLEMISTM